MILFESHLKTFLTTDMEFRVQRYFTTDALIKMMTRQPWGRQKYYSIFDIVRGRKVKPFSILNPTVSEENLSLLTFSGEMRLPGGGEAGAGEDEEEESVHPPGCGGHGHYHAACTNQLSTKLSHCMRPIMLSIANIITLSVSVQCPCPLYIFIFYACPFPLSYHILLPIPSFIECDVNHVPESQPSSSCPVPG